ncbi:hypothetical protein CDAR_476341 [Caerostris darwini]|uniref:Uncharacterized protein n=1 Tax=Caerostris darwini TaxID=1538125 RepID=A0AAV4TLZ0_9ARAC|nr:hypothetical protein CDAR_476341 [Caerostris darwini]
MCLSSKSALMTSEDCLELFMTVVRFILAVAGYAAQLRLCRGLFSSWISLVVFCNILIARQYIEDNQRYIGKRYSCREVDMKPCPLTLRCKTKTDKSSFMIYKWTNTLSFISICVIVSQEQKFNRSDHPEIQSIFFLNICTGILDH